MNEPPVSGAPPAGGAAIGRDELFNSLYRELRRTAERELRRAGRPALLSPTTILHETYIAMAARDAAFADRARFMAYASKAMRGLIIDAARERASRKRGGGLKFTTLATDLTPADDGPDTLESLGEALDRLGRLDARLVQVVDLKFFCGFSFAEIGALLGVSERTVQRDWDKARLVLHRFLHG